MKFTGNEITIRLPLPDKSLSPNARVHWAKKAKAVGAARFEARIAASNAMYPMDGPLWDAASVQCTFTFPTKRTPDLDNLAATQKATNDGLQDAGIVRNDRNFSHEPIVITEPDKANSGVTIRIKRLEA